MTNNMTNSKTNNKTKNKTNQKIKREKREISFLRCQRKESTKTAAR